MLVEMTQDWRRWRKGQVYDLGSGIAKELVRTKRAKFTKARKKPRAKQTPKPATLLEVETERAIQPPTEDR